MLQRLIAALIGVLGVAAAALGIASATAWRADDPLVATVTAGDATPTLVTDPGVLELADQAVTVRVSAGDDPVVLAVGRDTDVDAWIGSDPYERVTGLSDWHTLATVVGEAPAGTGPTVDATADATAEATEPAVDPSAAPTDEAATDETTGTAADPTGSDLWIVETSGDGSATLEWQGQTSGRWSLIAVSLGDTAPTLSLSWPQTVTTPWLWPGVAVGALLVAVSLVLGIRLWRRARLGPDADWHDVSTGMIAAVPRPEGVPAPAPRPAAPIVVGTVTAPARPAAEPLAAEPPAGTPATGVPAAAPGQPLTRRQIREAEAAAAAAAKRRGRRPATGAIPTIAPPTGATPVVPPASAPTTGTSPAGPLTTGTSTTTPLPTGASPSGASSDPAATSTPGTAASSRPTSAALPAPGRDGAGSSSAPAHPAAASSAPGASTPTPPRGGAVVTPARGTAGTAGVPGAPRPAAAPAPAATPTPTASAAPVASGAGTGAGNEEPPARRRGLSALLGRRGRATGSGTTPSPEPDAPGTPPAERAVTAWTPVPGAATRPPADPARPTPLTDPEDEDLSGAQRADAWRRMWGFTPDGGQPGSPTPPPTPPTDEAPRSTQEDR